LVEESKRVLRLLDAVLTVTDGLSLPGILEHVVEAACALVDARYAALGVIADDGTLGAFVHTGMEHETVEAIGQLPQGLGMLGLLTRDPRPIRLRDASQHPAARSYPPGHPPMQSFLGAPIRVGDQVFGNLYLTDKTTADEFSAEDEELVVGLAAVAGVAIANARLYGQLAGRQRWLEAVRQTTTALLLGQPTEEILQAVAQQARGLVDADVATIALPYPPDSLLLRVTDGLHADLLQGRIFPREPSLSGAVIATGRPMVVDDVSSDKRVAQPIVQLGAFGPVVLVPLLVEGTAAGTLVVGNRRGGRRFTRDEAEIVETFASHASLVYGYGQAQQRLQRLTLLEERERIARDLHDSTLQRLFATGLGIEQVAARLDNPRVVERLGEAVDELDAIMREIRSTLFGLRSPTPEVDFRDAIRATVDEVARPLGFYPSVTIEGADDEPLPSDVTEGLLMTLREALTNVAKHARATQASVRVSVAETARLRVEDNGIGIQPDRRGGYGLANMEQRAQSLGGACSVVPRPGGGTALEWWVPRVPSR
jgi:signal transduction histidine kinase